MKLLSEQDLLKRHNYILACLEKWQAIGHSKQQIITCYPQEQQILSDFLNVGTPFAQGTFKSIYSLRSLKVENYYESLLTEFDRLNEHTPENYVYLIVTKQFDLRGGLEARQAVINSKCKYIQDPPKKSYVNPTILYYDFQSAN